MTRSQPKPKWNRVTIVGVGLIGGSIGAALRSGRLAEQVVGVGRRRSSLGRAKRLGCIDRATTSLARGVAGAEFIVVCTPVGRIVDDVLESAAHSRDDAIILDAGSTKARIVAEVGKQWRGPERFVGSHPLAGSDKAGAKFARSDLLRKRLVVLTPTRKTPPDVLRGAERFWRALGAKTRCMTPVAHDRALAAVSHLPHLVASALSAATPVEHLQLAAGGWQDTTRIAAADPGLWRQIFQNNKDHVLKSLDRFESALARLRNSLETDDAARIEKLLETGKENRDSLGS